MLVKNGQYNSHSQASVANDILKARAATSSSHSYLNGGLGFKKSWAGGNTKKAPQVKDSDDRTKQIGDKINNLFRSIGKASYKSKQANSPNGRGLSGHKRRSKPDNFLYSPPKEQIRNDFLGVKKRSKGASRISSGAKKKGINGATNRDVSLKSKNTGKSNHRELGNDRNGYSTLYRSKAKDSNSSTKIPAKKRANTAPKTFMGRSASAQIGSCAPKKSFDRLNRLLGSDSGSKTSDNFFRCKDPKIKKDGISPKGRTSKADSSTKSIDKIIKKNDLYSTAASSSWRPKSKHGYSKDRTASLKKKSSRSNQNNSNNDGPLGSLVTQVKNFGGGQPIVPSIGHSKLSQPKLSSASKSKKKKKKKVDNNDIVFSNLKFNGVFYMLDLEIAFKTYSNIEKYTLYRTHFKQCTQSLGLLRKVAEEKPDIPEEMKVDFPPQSVHKKTVIFDLDETLIHCNEDQTAPFDVKVPVHFPTGEFIEAGINIRPYAKEILDNLAQHFEIVVFTASHSCYANPVIDYLDPTKRNVSKRLFRENCMQVAEGLYVKDLDIIRGRDLAEVVLVDNAAYSYSMQLENGIPIVPFYNLKTDDELYKLEKFLMGLLEIEDVRPKIKSSFKHGIISKYSQTPNTLFKKLFDI